MSWSLNLSEIERGDLRTKAEEAFQVSGNNHAEGEAREQLDAAIQAAQHIVDAVGAGPVNVNLSGHANPGHAPLSGYSNDTITVSVSSAAKLSDMA